jgi:organic radical activating enzyme
MNPWTDLQINYDGTYGVCCYHVPFQRETDDLAALWNSDAVKEMRENIINYDKIDSICHHCAMHRMSFVNLSDEYFKNALDFIDDKMIKQKRNIALAKKNFDEKRINTDHRPVKIYLNFGMKCNLSCIMCSQMNLRKQHKEILNPEFLFKQVDFLSHASEITIIGGEPFVLKPALDFLNFCSEHKELKNTQFNITTNGTVIDRHIDLLKKFKHLFVSFSIDSYGKYYEKIRLGATWEKVSKNVEMIHKNSKQHSGWLTPSIGSIVMKSGLPGLYDLCKWAVSNKLALGFGRVFDDADPSIKKENIFEYPNELDDIPEWQNIFRDCIAFLYKNNYDTPANQLYWYFSSITMGEIYKIQRDILLKSRWRRLGIALGIVKKHDFEYEKK